MNDYYNITQRLINNSMYGFVGRSYTNELNIELEREIMAQLLEKITLYRSLSEEDCIEPNKVINKHKFV